MIKATKVHALVQLICDRCGSTCERLSLAYVLPDGRIGEGVKPPGETVCNQCTKIERDEELRKYKMGRDQARWRRKHGIK